MIKIDKLTPGTTVAIQFAKQDDLEPAVFIGIKGTGDERTARFISANRGTTYEWSAYRYKGRWTFGSSAGSLKVVDIEHEPFKEVK